MIRIKDKLIPKNKIKNIKLCGSEKTGYGFIQVEYFIDTWGNPWDDIHFDSYEEALEIFNSIQDENK